MDRGFAMEEICSRLNRLAFGSRHSASRQQLLDSFKMEMLGGACSHERFVGLNRGKKGPLMALLRRTALDQQRSPGKAGAFVGVECSAQSAGASRAGQTLQSQPELDEPSLWHVLFSRGARRQVARAQRTCLSEVHTSTAALRSSGPSGLQGTCHVGGATTRALSHDVSVTERHKNDHFRGSGRAGRATGAGHWRNGY